MIKLYVRHVYKVITFILLVKAVVYVQHKRSKLLYVGRTFRIQFRDRQTGGIMFINGKDEALIQRIRQMNDEQRSNFVTDLLTALRGGNGLDSGKHGVGRLLQPLRRDHKPFKRR